MLYADNWEDAEGFTRHWQRAEELGRRTTLVDWPYRWHVAQARVKSSEENFDAALDLLADYAPEAKISPLGSKDLGIPEP